MRHEVEREFSVKMKSLDDELKIQKAEIAREKSQNNIHKNNCTQQVKDKERRLQTWEKELEKREKLLEVELRKMKATEKE